MIVADNERTLDLLYYEAPAKTVVRIMSACSNEPLSIGVDGDWGPHKLNALMKGSRKAGSYGSTFTTGTPRPDVDRNGRFLGGARPRAVEGQRRRTRLPMALTLARNPACGDRSRRTRRPREVGRLRSGYRSKIYSTSRIDQRPPPSEGAGRAPWRQAKAVQACGIERFMPRKGHFDGKFLNKVKQLWGETLDRKPAMITVDALRQGEISGFARRHTLRVDTFTQNGPEGREKMIPHLICHITCAAIGLTPPGRRP